MEENVVYDVPEVAEFLKVSTVTVERKLKNGEIQGKKVGAKWRILGSDVFSYLRSPNVDQG